MSAPSVEEDTRVTTVEEDTLGTLETETDPSFASAAASAAAPVVETEDEEEVISTSEYIIKQWQPYLQNRNSEALNQTFDNKCKKIIKEIIGNNLYFAFDSIDSTRDKNIRIREILNKIKFENMTFHKFYITTYNVKMKLQLGNAIMDGNRMVFKEIENTISQAKKSGPGRVVHPELSYYEQMMGIIYGRLYEYLMMSYVLDDTDKTDIEKLVNYFVSSTPKIVTKRKKSSFFDTKYADDPSFFELGSVLKNFTQIECPCDLFSVFTTQKENKQTKEKIIKRLFIECKFSSSLVDPIELIDRQKREKMFAAFVYYYNTLSIENKKNVIEKILEHFDRALFVGLVQDYLSKGTNPDAYIKNLKCSIMFIFSVIVNLNFSINIEGKIYNILEYYMQTIDKKIELIKSTSGAKQETTARNLVNNFYRLINNPVDSSGLSFLDYVIKDYESEYIISFMYSASNLYIQAPKFDALTEEKILNFILDFIQEYNDISTVRDIMFGLERKYNVKFAAQQTKEHYVYNADTQVFEPRSSSASASAAAPSSRGKGKPKTSLIHNILKGKGKEDRETFLNKAIQVIDTILKHKKSKNGSGKKSGVWELHKVYISKPLSVEKAKEMASKFIKGKKTFYKEYPNKYNFRNISKQKFNMFRGKKLNEDITLIYGRLKPEYEHLKRKRGGVKIEDLEDFESELDE